MSNIFAKLNNTTIKSKYIPVPFEFSFSQYSKSLEKDIIVNISKIKETQHRDEVYRYYGKENCKEYIGKIINKKEECRIYCVSLDCIFNKISDFDIDFPDTNISPLWTEERFGISGEEALLAFKLDKKIVNNSIQKKCEYEEKLQNLKININKSVLNTISECRFLIEKAKKCEAEMSKKCRKETANQVCKFLNDNFPVKAWVENIVEYVVFFSSDADTEEESIEIENAIELLFNSIDQDKSEIFFNKFVYDACSWPLVIKSSQENPVCLHRG